VSLATTRTSCVPKASEILIHHAEYRSVDVGGENRGGWAGTGFPSLQRIAGYHGSNELHYLWRVVESLQILELSLEDSNFMEVTDFCHVFVHVLVFIAQDACCSDIIRAIDIVYAVDITDMYCGSRASEVGQVKDEARQQKMVLSAAQLCNRKIQTGKEYHLCFGWP
jgi:hypothetical protein